MRTVRAVLFDLDDTLFDHRHCAHTALAGVRRAHACFGTVDPAEFEASHSRILEELHLDVLAGRVDLDAARIERFRRLYEWAGVTAAPEIAARAAAIYRQGYIEARREIEGAAALLTSLQSLARIVVVSNNVLDEQREKLCQCRLDRFVHALVVSEAVGVSKPDGRIFRVALERAEAEAEDAIMIGDSWANDIEGARAAGIRAIWFNREGLPSPDPQVPVIHRLTPVDDLIALIFEAPKENVRKERASALRP